MNADVQPSTDDLFDHVYATPTAALQRQRAAAGRGARAMTDVLDAPAAVGRR